MAETLSHQGQLGSRPPRCYQFCIPSWYPCVVLIGLPARGPYKLPTACWGGWKDANSLKDAKEYNSLYRRSGCVNQQKVPAVAAVWNKGNSWLNVKCMLLTFQFRQEINKAITKPLTRCVWHSLKCLCTETSLSTWLTLTAMDICSWRLMEVPSIPVQTWSGWPLSTASTLATVVHINLHSLTPVWVNDLFNTESECFRVTESNPDH